MIDLHCHILPGVDDGSRLLEESLKMAKIAHDDGIHKIVATPHVYEDIVGKEQLVEFENKRAELHESLKRNGINVELYSGAEVRISGNLVEKVITFREYLVIHQGPYLLIEFPSNHIYANVKQLLFDLMSEQIIPVVAHPERNYVFMAHPELLYEILQAGARLQGNSGSFVGLYGKKVQQAALQFLNWNFYHFIGSDAHNSSSLLPRLSEAMELVSMTAGENIARAIFFDNPQALLDNTELPFCPGPINPNLKQKSLKVKIPKMWMKKKRKKGVFS